MSAALYKFSRTGFPAGAGWPTVLLAAMLNYSALAFAENPAECSPMRISELAISPAPDTTASEPGLIYIAADMAAINTAGVSRLRGDVEVMYEGRKIRADSASYDATTGEINVDGDVELHTETLTVVGGKANFLGNASTGSFSGASFSLLDRNGRGDARKIEVIRDQRLILRDVRYTACPQGQNDWSFIAPEIEIDRSNQIGVGRNVRIEFKGVPILYTPFISFPVGDIRKSGFLLPDFSNNDRSGTDIAVPFYWDIAPNYDALLTARYLSSRGIQTDVKTRYLFANSTGELTGQYLPDDDLTGSDRIRGFWRHRSRFDNGFGIEIDAEEVSDETYYEDLTSSLAGASITHLEQRINVFHESDHWLIGLSGQAFSTLDETIDKFDRPYKRIPQLYFGGSYGGNRQINFDLRGDVTNFERADGARGTRATLQPAISLPFSGSAYFVEPSVQLAHSRYDLKETGFAGKLSDPSATVPIYSLDGRLFFERDARRKSARRYTLEPRVRYTHIPFVDQKNLPIFDTGSPDVNLVQLFRDNRYTGMDRIGDTDQLSFGVTTRLLDTEGGRELLTATLGQARYFGTRSVRLPNETFTTDSSNLIAEVGLGFSRVWNADLEYQWSPARSNTSKAAVRLQYQPARNKVINLAYRFQRNDLEQSDLSFAWPIGDNWNVVGRWNYSIDENRTLERFAGIEYSRCCWSARLVSRRFLNDRIGGEDTALFAQIELKGLTSIGARVDAFLEQGILGYGQE